MRGGFAFAALALLCACWSTQPLTVAEAPPGTVAYGLEELSSHTISTGPDQQADVVWVTVDGRPTRCIATASGPVCRRAQIQ